MGAPIHRIEIVIYPAWDIRKKLLFYSDFEAVRYA